MLHGIRPDPRFLVSNASVLHCEMRAIVYRDFGTPDVLKVEEVAKPVPADDEVLVAVRAAVFR